MGFRRFHPALFVAVENFDEVGRVTAATEETVDGVRTFGGDHVGDVKRGEDSAASSSASSGEIPGSTTGSVLPSLGIGWCSQSTERYRMA